MGRFRIETGSKTQREGAFGENIALMYLRLHGYRLLEKNYMVGHKEIDLIMRKGDTIAFIEVKAGECGEKLELHKRVDYTKRKNIVDAARVYIMRTAVRQKTLRFDVIEVHFRPLTVKHMKNAFYASDYVKC